MPKKIGLIGDIKHPKGAKTVELDIKSKKNFHTTYSNLKNGRSWEHIARILSPIKLKPVIHTKYKGEDIEKNRIDKLREKLNPNNDTTFFKAIITNKDIKK